MRAILNFCTYLVSLSARAAVLAWFCSLVFAGAQLDRRSFLIFAAFFTVSDITDLVVGEIREERAYQRGWDLDCQRLQDATRMRTEEIESAKLNSRSRAFHRL